MTLSWWPDSRQFPLSYCRYRDLMALGAINALHAQGIRVPEDISIIGFDNILYASAFEPALATIAQPIAAIGREWVTRLLERISLPEKQRSEERRVGKEG